MTTNEVLSNIDQSVADIQKSLLLLPHVKTDAQIAIDDASEQLSQWQAQALFDVRQATEETDGEKEKS